MEDTSIRALKDVGLSEREALIYLDLIQNGESKSGVICNRTSIPSSKIYFLLDRLIEMGLVSFRLINNIKIFRASEPDILSVLFEKKESQIKAEKENLLKSMIELKKISRKRRDLTDFSYFGGINGIKSAYGKLMNLWQEGDEIKVISAPETLDKLNQFLIKVVNKKRIRDQVGLKIIITSTDSEYGKSREKMSHTEVRYSNIETKSEIIVMKDYLILIQCSSEPYALFIKDKNFADTSIACFNQLWVSSSKK